MGIFHKDIFSLGRVHDRLIVREGNEKITFPVDGDPMRMMAGIRTAQKMLSQLTEETPEEKQREAAMYLAETILGKEGAGRLMEFYRGDATCVVTICGQYFTKRLAKKITKAQKKRG